MTGELAHDGNIDTPLDDPVEAESAFSKFSNEIPF